MSMIYNLVLRPIGALEERMMSSPIEPIRGREYGLGGLDPTAPLKWVCFSLQSK